MLPALDDRHSPFRIPTLGAPLAETAARIGRAVHGDAIRRLTELGPDLVGGGIEALYARHVVRGPRPIVWIGVGGSALGAQVVAEALLPDCDLRVIDNTDPACLARAFRGVDPSDCHFVLASKSGTTLETCAAAAVVDGLLPGGFAAHRDRVHVLVADGESPLHTFALVNGLEVVALPRTVGGRYSVFTPAGLLPLVLHGRDPADILAGAAAALELSRAEPDVCPGVRLGVTLALAHRLWGMGTHVLMPYTSELERFADWFVQLWAESLGKRNARRGTLVETGPTPLAALGSTDQHSMVQLLVEGPRDKLPVFVTIARPSRDFAVPRSMLVPDVVAARTLGELLAVQCAATAASLAEDGRPSLRLELPMLTAESLGATLATFLVATVVAAEIYDVDAFDQPGVERGKRIAVERLSSMRAGHAAAAPFTGLRTSGETPFARATSA